MRKYTAFRCPTEVLTKAKMFADSERRSLSNYLVRLLEQDAVRRAARDMRMERDEQKEAGQHLYRHPYSA